MAVLILLRHGHSSANADGVLAGWTPGIGLTPRGQEQAAAAADALADLPVSRIVSSPLQRCLETARAVAARLDRPVETDEALGECHYGTWTGRPLAELARDELWRTVQDDPASAAFAGSAAYPGESLAQMADRVTGAVARIDAEVARDHGEDALWVAVSHGDPIKAVLADAAGAGVDGLQRMHVDPGSISVVRRTGGRSMLLTTNRGTGPVAQLLAHSTPAGAPGDAEVGGGAGSP